MINATLDAADSPKLSSKGGIKGGMRGTACAGALISTYCNTILTQPDITTDFLEQLPDHQKVARSHATLWQSAVQPLIISTNADIIDFANDFGSYYSPLVQLAVRIVHDPTDQEAIETFKQGLRLLKATAGEKQDNAAKVITSLASFSSDLAGDARNFTNDYNKVLQALAGEDGAISSLEDQIEAIHSAMRRDNAIIAGGAGGIVLGAILIGVGAVAEIATAGASTALVVGGLAVAGAGTAATIAGGVDLGKQTKALGKLIPELAADRQIMAAAKSVSSSVKGFSEQAIDAHKAAGTLLAGWQILDKEFDEFDQALDRVDADTGFFLQAQLHSAYEDWTDVAAQAKHLQHFFDPKVIEGVIGPDGKVLQAAAA